MSFVGDNGVGIRSKLELILLFVKIVEYSDVCKLPILISGTFFDVKFSIQRKRMQKLEQIPFLQVVHQGSRHPAPERLVFRVVKLLAPRRGPFLVALVVVDTDQVQHGTPVADTLAGALQVGGGTLLVNLRGLVVAL